MSQQEKETPKGLILQGAWPDIFDNSIMSADAVCKKYNLNRSSFMSWVRDNEKQKTPITKNFERMQVVMTELRDGEKRIKKHPSYGYAYPWQIDRLNEIGIGAERTQILKEIEKQTKAKGKVK